jgi:hypothetical protein
MNKNEEQPSSDVCFSSERSTILPPELGENEPSQSDGSGRSSTSKVTDAQGANAKLLLSGNNSRGTNFNVGTSGESIASVDLSRRGWESKCEVRGKQPAPCQRRIKELIGKHELKNEELEQRENHLHRRVQVTSLSLCVMCHTLWTTILFFR